MIRQFILLLSILLLISGCRQPLANQSQSSLFGGDGGYNLPGDMRRPGGMFAGQNTGGGLFNTGFNGGVNQQPSLGQVNQLAGEVGSLSTRLNQFNSDNENLHAQVAALQQRLQNSNNYNDQLKQQLSDQMAQLQQAQVQVQQISAQSQQQIAAAQSQYQQSRQANQVQTNQLASTGNGGSTRFAGATIHANNGLMQKLQTVQLPGYKPWMDGDVIRIEGPTDRLFVSGTYQVNQNDSMTLANLANTIRQNFPRQVIGIEAHWDGTPIQPATTSHHQMTATQALAVFDLLVKSGLPHDQVFTMAMGSNRPRYPNGNAANRRIEIVIYPETF